VLAQEGTQHVRRGAWPCAASLKTPGRRWQSKANWAVSSTSYAATSFPQVAADSPLCFVVPRSLLRARWREGRKHENKLPPLDMHTRATFGLWVSHAPRPPRSCRRAYRKAARDKSRPTSGIFSYIESFLKPPLLVAGLGVARSFTLDASASTAMTVAWFDAHADTITTGINNQSCKPVSLCLRWVTSRVLSMHAFFVLFGGNCAELHSTEFMATCVHWYSAGR